MISNETKKYIRQIMLPEIGKAGQEKIRNARVLLIGCGGLGCPALLYLAAAGVGTIGIAEFDVITISNLHRQVLFGNQDVGIKKANRAAELISAQHPEVTVIRHDLVVNADNVAGLIADYDMVLDGCDNFATRYAVNDACTSAGKPLVYGSILGFEVQLAVFNHLNGKNLRDLFPEPPDPADVPDCSENGVMPTVPGIGGTYMAQACLEVILGIAQPSGSYYVMNVLSRQTNTLNY